MEASLIIGVSSFFGEKRTDTNNHGDRIQATPGHVDVANQQFIERQPANQQRCNPPNRFTNHDVPAHLPPDVQQHLSEIFYGQSDSRKYHSLLGHIMGKPCYITGEAQVQRRVFGKTSARSPDSLGKRAEILFPAWRTVDGTPPALLQITNVFNQLLTG